MKKTFFLSACLLLFVLLSVFAYKSYDRSHQEHPLKKILREKGMVTGEYDNLKITTLKTVEQSERDELAIQARESIANNLALIQESPFEDTIHLILVPTQNDMKNILGAGIGGSAYPKNYEFYPEGAKPEENLIYAIYGGKHNTLGHEIMHMVTYLKWGQTYSLWLDEGLATLACPEAENCDEHTFEERYIYFLQNRKLIIPDSTMNFNREGDDLIQNKIFYNQSAYIVEFLIDNYGMEKFKILWKEGMDDFEKIYAISLENCLQKINDELNKKYPNPIDFNWEEFTKDCIE